MRKRIRKKRRVGEFQELGFEVQFRLKDVVSEPVVDTFWDGFIREAIEGHGLMCGGGCGRHWDVFVARGGRGSATEDHRAAIKRWLDSHPDVEAVRVGPLVDAWHSA